MPAEVTVAIESDHFRASGEYGSRITARPVSAVNMPFAGMRGESGNHFVEQDG